MQLSQEDLRHLAELAKLKLTDEQLGKLEKGIPSVLQNMQKIAQLDLATTPDTLITVPANNYLREDDVIEPLSQTEALQNVPHTYKGYVVVPGIFTEE